MEFNIRDKNGELLIPFNSKIRTPKSKIKSSLFDISILVARFSSVFDLHSLTQDSSAPLRMTMIVNWRLHTAFSFLLSAFCFQLLAINLLRHSIFSVCYSMFDIHPLTLLSKPFKNP